MGRWTCLGAGCFGVGKWLLGGRVVEFGMERRTVGWARNFVGEWESMTASEWARFCGHPKFDAMADLYLTARCLVDFWWHLRFGVYFSAWKHYDPVLHRRAARWLQVWRTEVDGAPMPVARKALIMSRELCKTQMLIAYQGWRFADDPDRRLLIRSCDDPLAGQISSALQKMVLSKKFQRRYPWVRPAVRSGSTQWERWTPGEWMLARNDEDVRVPSCQAMGVEGTPTGGHFHSGYYDDFEAENALTEIGREKMFSVIKNDDNLFMAGSQRLIAGTPWHAKGLIQRILDGKEEDVQDIDLFRQPCCVAVFDAPFDFHEPVLVDDRVTLRCAGAGYPTVMADLSTCQVVVRFFSKEAGDVIEETREVVWNDGDHLRVNRPFGVSLGQPLFLTVGTEKPACPIRQTLDVVDWVPDLGASLPAVVARHASVPGVGELNGRFSLPKKRKVQGSLVYNAQQLLMHTDVEALVLRSKDVREICWEDVPAGTRRWRRACDMASAKVTAAATSMTTGFEIDGWGFCITHICYVEQMSTTWKLLELVWGMQRVKRWGGRIETTSFEKSGHIEETIHDLLPDVCRAPYEYFMRLKKGTRPSADLPTYQEIAEEWFRPGEPVHIPLKWLPRTQSKNDRLSKQQPVWESGKLFVLDTCPYREVLRGQADRFTMASEEPFDLLDNTADLLNEGRLLKQSLVAKPKAMSGTDDYNGRMQEASMRARERAGMALDWGGG